MKCPRRDSRDRAESNRTEEESGRAGTGVRRKRSYCKSSLIDPISDCQSSPDDAIFKGFLSLVECQFNPLKKVVSSTYSDIFSRGLDLAGLRLLRFSRWHHFPGLRVKEVDPISAIGMGGLRDRWR